MDFPLFLSKLKQQRNEPLTLPSSFIPEEEILNQKSRGVNQQHILGAFTGVQTTITITTVYSASSKKAFPHITLFFFFNSSIFIGCVRGSSCFMDSMVHISRWGDEEESVGNMQERWVSVPDRATHYPHHVIKT